MLLCNFTIAHYFWVFIMDNLLKKIKNLIIDHKAFLMYGIISVFVTIVDVVVCRLCEHFLSPVVANTIGVVTGFIIQYFLAARHVYNTKSMKSFIIFLATFFLNLLMANGIVYVCRSIIFDNSTDNISFLVSKAASIVFPFFITYFIRKKLMPSEEKNNE